MEPQHQLNNPNNPPPQPPITPENSGLRSPYNRESGQKTLVLIGIIIAAVTILSVLSLMMINKKSSVLIQSNYREKHEQPKIIKTILTPTPANLEDQINKIDNSNFTQDIETLNQEATQLDN